MPGQHLTAQHQETTTQLTVKLLPARSVQRRHTHLLEGKHQASTRCSKKYFRGQALMTYYLLGPLGLLLACRVGRRQRRLLNRLSRNQGREITTCERFEQQACYAAGWLLHHCTASAHTHGTARRLLPYVTDSLPALNTTPQAAILAIELTLMSPHTCQMYNFA